MTCTSCGKAYDAEKAPECSCLQPVRTYRCPHCAGCFCSAPKSVVDTFWREASEEMWQRRRARAASIEPNAPPDVIARPMVLFADDDPTGRAIAARVISALGYGVAVAEDGQQALEIARSYKPDLIITDAFMPRLDGREMGRTIKRELPATKVVVITSVYKDPRYKHEALRDFQVDAYLHKPVNPTELRTTVRKFLA
ncbi:MAG TPA: response regulator [Thermoanaerobaculia bacterium]